MTVRLVLWLFAALAWVWVTGELVAPGLTSSQARLVVWLALTVVMVVAIVLDFRQRANRTKR